MSLIRKQLNKFLKEIKLKDKIVADIGSGTRPVKDYIQMDGCFYITMDINKDCNPDIILNLGKVDKKDYSGYDVIFCLEVLEHIPNTTKAIENLYKMLMDGGVLYLSVPFLYPRHSNSDYYRFTSDGIRRYLNYSGFKNIEIKTRVATKGKKHLDKFYKAEEIEFEGEFEMAYFIKAQKLV